MTSSIGFTPIPQERKEYWEKVYRGVRNWTLLGGPFSKTKAGLLAKRLSLQYGPDSFIGENMPDNGKAVWYVYYFEHESRKLEVKAMSY